MSDVAQETKVGLPPGPERVHFFNHGTKISSVNLGDKTVAVDPPYVCHDTGWYLMNVVRDLDKGLSALKVIIKYMVAAETVLVSVRERVEDWSISSVEGLKRRAEFESLVEAQRYVFGFLEAEKELDAANKLVPGDFHVIVGAEAKFQ